MGTTSRSTFDDVYLAGVPRALPKPSRPVDAGLAAVAPTGPIALGGVVVRADGVMPQGWVVVADGHIADIVANKPSGVTTLDTGGVIMPGLIDLHGHPEFNVFTPWEPPKTFINRSQWRGSPIYQQLVRDPWDQLTKNGQSPSAKKAMTRYAEVRALVGGVTAIQGASQDYPNKAEALVRNVDLVIFGSQIARSTVDFGRLRPNDIESIRKGIDNQTVKAHYVHLAEGQKTNQASINEFIDFTKSPLFGPATVMIHGTALSRTHFDDLASVGGKLVWSPQSNLRLYTETTDIKAALDAKLPVAIGADWMPSGSQSLLHELKIAERCLAEQGCNVTSKQLVGMVTSDAARIASLDDKLGQLEPGRPADIVVFQQRVADAYDNVVAAYPSWVDLVMIGGDITYARTEWINPIATTEYEPVIAWGRPMSIDTRFGSPEQTPDGPPRRLADIRRQLISRYPAVGPIFA